MLIKNLNKKKKKKKEKNTNFLTFQIIINWLYLQN